MYFKATDDRVVNLAQVAYLDYQQTEEDCIALIAVMPDGKSIWLATAPDKAGLQDTVRYILERQSYKQYIAIEPGATVGTYPAC